MKRLFILIFFSLISKAADVVGSYITYDSVSLTSAAEKLTIQQVANSTTDLQLVAGTMWCSVATTFTLSRTGTAATTTTLAPTILNVQTPTQQAKTFTTSNVGSGTVIRTYNFNAGAAEIVIDLSNFLILRSAGTTGNVTLSTSSITGTCILTFVWNEVR